MLDSEDHGQDRYESTREMPLFLKGEEIVKIVEQMLELAPEGNKHLTHTISWMRESAFLLCVKVAGAEGGDLYDIRMENATIIRKAARELLVNTQGLKMHGYQHTEYLDVLRDALEEYRLLFIEWVARFDQWNYIVDRWGLFNPPGVGPHDKDPDDDIPFNPNDFFDSE